MNDKDNSYNYTPFQKKMLEKNNNNEYYKIKNYLSFLDRSKSTIKECNNEKLLNTFSEKYINSLYVINSHVNKIKPISIEESNFKNSFRNYIEGEKKKLGSAYLNGNIKKEILNSNIAEYGFNELKKIGKNVSLQNGKEF